MKRSLFAQVALPVALFGACSFGSCNSGPTATDPEPPPPASASTPDTAIATNSTTALQIAASDSLKPGVDSILKAYPGVRASIDSGVITLRGKIQKDQFQKLMDALHELHPKDVRDNLHLK